MRTALLIARISGVATVILGPDADPRAAKAEFKGILRDLDNEKFKDFESLEVWTSDAGRVKRAKLNDRKRGRAVDQKELVAETAAQNDRNAAAAGRLRDGLSEAAAIQRGEGAPRRLSKKEQKAKDAADAAKAKADKAAAAKAKADAEDAAATSSSAESSPANISAADAERLETDGAPPAAKDEGGGEGHFNA